MPAKVYEKVIVFGPTGNVGSIAAQTAAKYGSQVYLAMRDTKKPIPGLGAADEKSAGSYHRVQADLTKPDTIKDALKKTDGAKAAFLYLAHGSQDGMKSVFQALKDGGIEHVVFLSSFTVPDKQKQMEKVAQEDYISYVHTQAELSLASLYSEKEYVALRPGYFATNVLQQKLGIIAGAVRVYRSDLTWDYITPEDMGNVAGSILAKGQRDGQNIVYLFGPDMLSQREAFLKVGKAIEKDLTVSDADETEAVEGFVANGMPEHFAKYMVSKAGERKQGEDFVSKKQYETGKANVEKYAARPGMRLDDWADKNKDSISSEIKDVATEMPESAPEPEEPEEEEEEAKEGEEGEGEEGEKKEGDEGDDKKEKKDDKKE